MTIARRVVGFSSRIGITAGPYRRSRPAAFGRRFRGRLRPQAVGWPTDRPLRVPRAPAWRGPTMPPKIPTMPQASDWKRVLETGMQFTELRRSQARAIVSDLVAQGHLARDQMGVGRRRGASR